MAPNNMTDHEMIADERDRLIRLESKFELIGTLVKLAWVLVVIFIGQTSGGMYAFAQLSEKVNGIKTDEIEQNLSSALSVISGLTVEHNTMRAEHQRLRGNIDAFRDALVTKTKERFYKSDGDKHDVRITRLEQEIFFKLNGAP